MRGAGLFFMVVIVVFILKVGLVRPIIFRSQIFCPLLVSVCYPNRDHCDLHRYNYLEPICKIPKSQVR